MTQQTQTDDTEAREEVSKSRQAAGETLSAVGDAVAAKEKSGLLSKIALARTAWALVRRYPIAALCVGGVALALLLVSSRRANMRTHLH